MRAAIAVLQGVVQAISSQPGGPGAPGGPPPGFSITKALFELLQFVGYFFAIGAVGFRFGIVRCVRGMSEKAKTILRPDNAAVIGMIGVILLVLFTLGGPYVDSITHHKTFAESLPKNLGPFELKMVMLVSPSRDLRSFTRRPRLPGRWQRSGFSSRCCNHSTSGSSPAK